MKKINIQIFKDGNSWCATFDNFQNLQESSSGFGDTPGDAVNELIEDYVLSEMAKEVE